MIAINDKNGTIVTNGDKCLFVTLEGEDLKGIIGFSIKDDSFGFDTDNSKFIPMLKVRTNSIEKIENYNGGIVRLVSKK